MVLNKTRNINYYHESGKINPIGLTIFYIICLAASFVLGYIYAAIIVFNPFIYFNFLACFALGVILGYVVRLVVFAVRCGFDIAAALQMTRSLSPYVFNSYGLI